jgi:3D (Asp-Asp-Asp) domain-containing protein
MHRISQIRRRSTRSRHTARKSRKVVMNSFKLIPLFLFLLTLPAFAKDDSRLARVTVYWASGGSGSDRNTRNHRCATGTRLRAGHCAVDPRHIPYGSRVLLPNGETLAAVDTGSAVRNRKAARIGGRTAFEKQALVIDRFFETKGQALAWANSHPAFMPIRILRPNSATAAVMPANRVAAGKQAEKITPASTGSASQLIASNGFSSRTSLIRMGR